MDTTFIYALTEPGTRAIRYFGKANSPQKRCVEHIRDAKKGLKYRVYNWIRKLSKVGQRPDVHVLCEVPGNDWERFERAFIALGKQCGFDLTNVTPGGETGPSRLGTKHSPETIKKMCEDRAGEKHPHFGKKFSPEYRAKLSAAHIGLNAGEKHPMFGKHHSPTSCAKISASKLGKKLTPAQCLKHAEARIGLKYEGAASKFWGVSWRAARNNWRARIVVSGKVIFIGNFTNEIEAAKAFDAAAIKYRGTNAVLNFPD